MINDDSLIEFLSDDEIIKRINIIKEKHNSPSQIMYSLKKLLSNVANPEIVIEEIPNLLVCTSSEFIELYSIFNSIVIDHPDCVSSLLSVLMNFDYDSKAKTFAFKLALEIFERIETNKIQKLIPYLLFTVPKGEILQLYRRLKEILTIHKLPELYKAFEKGIKSHFSAFFHSIKSTTQWSFFEFFILLISQNHPSLRSSFPSLIWSSISSNNLKFDQLIAFIKHNNIICQHFNLLVSLFDIFMTTIPKIYELSLIYPMSSFAFNICIQYPNLCSVFLDNLISYLLNGTKFQSNVAVNCLLSISSNNDSHEMNSFKINYFSKRITEFDDYLAQSNLLTSMSINTLCQIISNWANDDQIQSTIMISLQKKLFHPSQRLVEVGIILSLHFINYPNFNEILKWVLNAIHVNSLVESMLNPSSLLTIFNIKWANVDIKAINSVSNFCANILNTFNIIQPYTKDSLTIGGEPSDFLISIKKIPSEQHCELCGEALFFLYCYFNNFQTKKKNSQKSKLNNKKIKFIKNLPLVCFEIPGIFYEQLNSNDNNKESEKTDQESSIKAAHIENMVKLRALLLPFIYRSNSKNFDLFKPFLEIIKKIDVLFLSPSMNKFRIVSDLYYLTFFPIPFCFEILMDKFFIFPNDLDLLFFLFHSIYTFFVDTVTHRFSIYNKLEFLKSFIPQNIAIRILVLVQRFIDISNEYRQSNQNLIMKKCLRAASFGIDFLSFCLYSEINIELNFYENVAQIINDSFDVGITCRLILLGSSLGINKSVLANLASKCCNDNSLRCDLCENKILFPLGFPELNSIVRPMVSGGNWRLIVYLSLQYNNFDSFKDQFLSIIGLINDGLMEIEMCFILILIMNSKINEFKDNFPQFLELCIKLFDLFIICDINALKADLSLLTRLNVAKTEIMKNDEDLDHNFSYFMDIKELFTERFKHFNGVQGKQAFIKVIAQIQGECELLSSTSK